MLDGIPGLICQHPASSIPASASDILHPHPMPTVLLAYYCALILVASIVGGMIPVWFQLTHRWMQFAVSFVAGVMLGIGVLHMLPHAIVDAAAAADVMAAAAPPDERAAQPCIDQRRGRAVDRDLAVGRHAGDVLHRAVFQLPSPRRAG